MPLQKMSTQSGSPTNTTATRPQTQSRRRTLQTISELSSTDVVPSFVSSIQPEKIQQVKNGALEFSQKKTPSSSKRQSLPQYRAPPPPQPSIIVTPIHRPSPQQSQSMPIFIPSVNANSRGNGYNAKRDRARSRQEQELANARLQQAAPVQRASGDRSSISSRPSMSSMTSRSNETQARLYVDQQQQLLRNSRSMTGAPQLFEQPRISTDTEAYQYDHDTEPSERTSTGSSSARDVVVGRSRSGSSNTSYTSQDTPPLPKTTTQYHYSTPQDQDLVSFGESARSKNLRSRRSARTFSLPSYQHPAAPHTCTCGSINPNLAPTTPTQTPKRAHAEALAALTSNDRQLLERSTSLPASAFPPIHIQPANSHHYSRHLSLTSHPPLPSHNNRRYYAESYHRASSTGSQTPRTHTPRHSSERPRTSLEARTVPRRESLTQWKAEREANSVVGRRAAMQERVRRANEMEEAREKELVSLGKRGEVGCFGGLMSRVRGRRG